MHLLNKHQNDLHQSIKTIDFTKQRTPLRVQSKHSGKERFPLEMTSRSVECFSHAIGRTLEVNGFQLLVCFNFKFPLSSHKFFMGCLDFLVGLLGITNFFTP